MKTYKLTDAYNNPIGSISLVDDVIPHAIIGGATFGLGVYYSEVPKLEIVHLTLVPTPALPLNVHNDHPKKFTGMRIERNIPAGDHRNDKNN